MTTARSQLIRPDITPYYHCASRCVRRPYLCGYDPLSGQSYDHRRDWAEQRILSLAQIYCIRICAYAVMSNHYHLVAYIDQDTAASLSNTEVIERWATEHQLPEIISRFLTGQLSSELEKQTCHNIINTWRERLHSLSWFMKELNYGIALLANREDECTGRFWEGRFRSQALLDDKALLAAMAYVDLNPIRSNMADTPEKSEYTSIKNRLDKLDQGQHTAFPLSDFIGEQQPNTAFGLPFRLLDYIELVDWVGRQLRNDKPGRIDAYQPEILRRLSLQQRECLALCSGLEGKYRLWIGSHHKLQDAKSTLNRKRLVGLSIS